MPTYTYASCQSHASFSQRQQRSVTGNTVFTLHSLPHWLVLVSFFSLLLNSSLLWSLKGKYMRFTFNFGLLRCKLHLIPQGSLLIFPFFSQCLLHCIVLLSTHAHTRTHMHSHPHTLAHTHTHYNHL